MITCRGLSLRGLHLVLGVMLMGGEGRRRVAVNDKKIQLAGAEITLWWMMRLQFPSKDLIDASWMTRTRSS